MQHISLGPIPVLPVRLILGVRPGRFGGVAGGEEVSGPLGKPEKLQGRKSGTCHRESVSSLEGFYHGAGCVGGLVP